MRGHTLYVLEATAMHRNPDDCGQPEEWERVLEDVTVPRDAAMLPFEPGLLDDMYAVYSEGYRRLLDSAPDTQVERWAELERLRAIAKRKLSGARREVFLLFLTGKHSLREIGRLLGLSKDRVRRHVEQAGALMKEHIAAGEERRSFPAARRDGLKTAILPLDTAAERRAFMALLNERQIVHLAYGGSGDFREALVVYR